MIAAAFVFSRLLAYGVGVTFYGSFVHRLWQGIDVSLLRDDLLPSLLYSHAQPPLFNLLTGVLVKLFPQAFMTVFQLLNLALSLATALLIHSSLTRMRLPEKLAFAVALIYVISPAVILYENIYSYTILTVFMLTFITYAFISFAVTQRLRYWTFFCIMLAAIVLTRSSFHLVFMLVVITGSILLIPKQFILKRKMAAYALIPFLMALSWYGKNLIIFDTFSSSSWLGMNLARVVRPETDLGRVGPFKPLELYAGLYDSNPNQRDIAVLRKPYKSSTGYINFFHEDYLIISKQFFREAMTTIKGRPALYLMRVTQSFIIYFSPATHAPFIDKNLARLEPYSRTISLDWSGVEGFSPIRRSDTQSEEASIESYMRQNGFTITYALPAIVLFAGMLIAAAWLFYKSAFSKPESLIILFCVSLLTYGMLVGNLFEFGENNRFRFEAHTVFLILAATTLWRFYYFFKTYPRDSKK